VIHTHREKENNPWLTGDRLFFRTAEPDLTHIRIVGRLVEVKGVDLFLETAAFLEFSEQMAASLPKRTQAPLSMVLRDGTDS
jgi:hypothetical protein